MLACDCKRKCKEGSCSCIDAGLKCSEACSYQKCDNMNAAADTETEQSDGDLDDLDDDDDFLFDL